MVNYFIIKNLKALDPSPSAPPRPSRGRTRAISNDIESVEEEEEVPKEMRRLNSWI